VDDHKRLLQAAAERVADDPFFLAGALAPVIAAELLDEAALSARLGCVSENIAPILLCRRPRREPAAFRADIEAIARRFGANPLALAELVREADSLSAFAANRARQQNLLAAARDREPDDSEMSSPETKGGQAP
jgi:hypothetical protein